MLVMPHRLILRISGPLVLLLCAAACQSTVPDADVAQVETAEHGDKALEPFLQRAKDHPEDPEVLYELGNALYDARRFEQAVLVYQRALELAPRHTGLLGNAGLCFRMLGHPDRAIKYYRRALRIEPDDTTTLRNLVLALEAMGDFKEAIDPAARLTQLTPDDVHAHSTYGNILLQAGRYHEAIEAYKRVLAIDPGHSGDYYNLGLCHFYLESWDAAIAAWLTALAHDPQNASVRKGLAVVYWRRGDYDQAWHAVWECQRRGIPLAADFIEDLQRDSGRTGLDASDEWAVSVRDSANVIAPR